MSADLQPIELPTLPAGPYRVYVDQWFRRFVQVKLDTNLWVDVAEVYGGWSEPATKVAMSEAFSRLFAAAPDLLTALKTITDRLVEDTDDDGPTEDQGAAIVVARLAIAKAEGRS